MSNEKCRESDRYLMASMWWEDNKRLGVKTFEQFLRAFVEGKFTNPESIRRPRAKITNEDYPHLASKKVKAKRERDRKQNMVDLGYIKDPNEPEIPF